MNNEHESTYTLLVRSEEKGRGVVETMVYALLGLAVVVSIWQFAQQPNPLPVDRLTSESYSAPHVSRYQADAWLNRKS